MVSVELVCYRKLVGGVMIFSGSSGSPGLGRVCFRPSQITPPLASALFYLSDLNSYHYLTPTKPCLRYIPLSELELIVDRLV